MCDNEDSHSLLVGRQSGTATLEDSWEFLIKLNILLVNDSVAVLLGIYRNKWETYIDIKTYTQVFIATLCITDNIWKQP